MKPVSYKRILAYLIDILIVSFIGSLITYFIPVSDKYEKSLDEFYELMGKMTDKDVNQNEYLEQVTDLSYTMSRESITSTAIIVLISIGYYVVFVNNNDGQTLGKKLMKIKTVSNNKKNLTMKNYFLRALFINSILVDTVSIILILVLKKSVYLQVSDALSTAFGVFYLVTFAMILFRNDGRGLHDIIASTKVVSCKEDKLNEEEINQEDLRKEKEESIEEALIVEEKKEKSIKKDEKLSRSNKEKVKKSSAKTTTSKNKNKSTSKNN